jgi:hypothetical protein
LPWLDSTARASPRAERSARELLTSIYPSFRIYRGRSHVKICKKLTAASREEGMQANPHTDHLSGKGAAEPSAAISKLPEYAYRAAILLAMMLLLWTVV